MKENACHKHEHEYEIIYVQDRTINFKLINIRNIVFIYLIITKT